MRRRENPCANWKAARTRPAWRSHPMALCLRAGDYSRRAAKRYTKSICGVWRMAARYALYAGIGTAYALWPSRRMAAGWQAPAWMPRSASGGYIRLPSAEGVLDGRHDAGCGNLYHVVDPGGNTRDGKGLRIVACAFTGAKAVFAPGDLLDLGIFQRRA